MSRRIAYVLSALALVVSTPVQAADVTRTDLSGTVAEASFSSFHGCEDVVVGATVDGPSSTVTVFGSIVDVCEFGTSSFFYGTVPLAPGEFVEGGVDGAALEKTLAIDGAEIRLSLRWSGVGETVTERSRIDEDDGTVRVVGHRIDSRRAADVSGSFVVNGLDRVSGDSSAYGNLHVVRGSTTAIVSGH